MQRCPVTIDQSCGGSRRADLPGHLIVCGCVTASWAGDIMHTFRTGSGRPNPNRTLPRPPPRVPAIARPVLLSSVSSVALVAATVTLLATIPPRLAQAQQVVANGTTQTASGTIDTGTAAPTAGYTLWALNNGVITSSSPLVLLNNTSGVPIVVRAESGGQITLFNGTTATAGP